MDIDTCFPGRFIKSAEFRGRDVTLTIASVVMELFEDDRKRPNKVVMAFRETKKELIVNRTNCICIKGMFGKETDDWIDKRIVFFPAPNSFGDSDTCIRVRGSPDLVEDKQIEISLPRKTPFKWTLKRITKKSNGKATTPPAESPPDLGPDVDPAIGEIHEPGAEG